MMCGQKLLYYGTVVQSMFSRSWKYWSTFSCEKCLPIYLTYQIGILVNKMIQVNNGHFLKKNQKNCKEKNVFKKFG